MLAVAAIVIALVGLFWNLAGSPALLAPTNLRRLSEYLRSRPAEWSAAKRERVRDMEEDRLLREQTKTEARVKGDLRRTVVRLHEMESGDASYHKTEWKSQKALCKEAALEIVRYLNYRVCRTGSNWQNVVCKNYGTDTIIVRVAKSRWRRRTLQLCILIHPSPSLTDVGYAWPEVFGGSATVLSTPLTAGDLERLGWEFPDDWETWQTKRIPGRSLPELMTPEILRIRQVSDWDPRSPFAGSMLPE